MARLQLNHLKLFQIASSVLQQKNWRMKQQTCIFLQKLLNHCHAELGPEGVTPAVLQEVT
jgi:hypothetical protein